MWRKAYLQIRCLVNEVLFFDHLNKECFYLIECKLRSLGCVFHEINYLEMAFDGRDRYELENNIKKRNMANVNNFKIKSKINDLMNK